MGRWLLTKKPAPAEDLVCGDVVPPRHNRHRCVRFKRRRDDLPLQCLRPPLARPPVSARAHVRLCGHIHAQRCLGSARRLQETNLYGKAVLTGARQLSCDDSRFGAVQSLAKSIHPIRRRSLEVAQWAAAGHLVAERLWVALVLLRSPQLPAAQAQRAPIRFGHNSLAHVETNDKDDLRRAIWYPITIRVNYTRYPAMGTVV
jgi:hypothetical protein